METELLWFNSPEERDQLLDRIRDKLEGKGVIISPSRGTLTFPDGRVTTLGDGDKEKVKGKTFDKVSGTDDPGLKGLERKKG